MASLLALSVYIPPYIYAWIHRGIFVCVYICMHYFFPSTFYVPSLWALAQGLIYISTQLFSSSLQPAHFSFVWEIPFLCSYLLFYGTRAFLYIYVYVYACLYIHVRHLFYYYYYFSSSSSRLLFSFSVFLHLNDKVFLLFLSIYIFFSK